MTVWRARGGLGTHNLFPKTKSKTKKSLRRRWLRLCCWWKEKLLRSMVPSGINLWLQIAWGYFLLGEDQKMNRCAANQLLKKTGFSDSMQSLGLIHVALITCSLMESCLFHSICSCCCCCAPWCRCLHAHGRMDGWRYVLIGDSF